MSDLDIRSRFDEATRPAFAKPFDATEDLARGQQARRHRRLRQVAAGTSACAIAGAAVVAGLPVLADGPSKAEGSPASTSTVPSEPNEDAEAIADRLGHAFRDHVGPALDPGYFRLTVGGEDARIAGSISGPGESEARLLIRDDVRNGAEPVPLRCADDPAYDICERQTLDDSTEIVVGQGADDLRVAAWGRDGDLIEVTAHWADGVEHNVTLDGLIELATDDRFWVPEPTEAVRFVGIPGSG